MGSLIEFLNGCGELFVSSMGSMLIQSSVLIAILFCFDLLLRRRIRAVVRYCLWMLVLAKLVLPITLAVPFSMGYWAGDAFDRVKAARVDAAAVASSPVQAANESPAAPAQQLRDVHVPRVVSATDEAMTPHTQPLPRSISTLHSIAERPMLPVRQETYPSQAPPTGHHLSASTTESQSTTNSMPPAPPVEARSDHGRLGVLTWQGAVFCLWLAVCTAAALLVLQKTLLVGMLVRQALPGSEGLVELFEFCRERVGVRRDVGILVSSVIPTPAVYGLFRPMVLIPETMFRHNFDEEELEAVFIHELVHIQRSDLWVRLLQTILQVVYFYNPLLWAANATIRRVRELAVDETVLVILGSETSRVYPRTLLKVAGALCDQPIYGLRLIGVMESNDLLRERITAMLHKPIPHSRKVGVIGLLSLFILGVFLLPMARADGQQAPTEAAKQDVDGQPAVASTTTEAAENRQAVAIAAKEAAESRQAAVRQTAEMNQIRAMEAEIASLQRLIQVQMAELRALELELEEKRLALDARIHGRDPAEILLRDRGPAAARPAETSTTGPVGVQPPSGFVMAAVPGQSDAATAGRSVAAPPGSRALPLPPVRVPAMAAVPGPVDASTSRQPATALPGVVAMSAPAPGEPVFAAVPAGSDIATSREPAAAPAGVGVLSVPAPGEPAFAGVAAGAGSSPAAAPSGPVLAAEADVPHVAVSEPSVVESVPVSPPRRRVFAAAPGVATPVPTVEAVAPKGSALRQDISGEVRIELQRILPGLLREMLPKLLEAEIKAMKTTTAAKALP